MAKIREGIDLNSQLCELRNSSLADRQRDEGALYGVYRMVQQYVAKKHNKHRKI